MSTEDLKSKFEAVFQAEVLPYLELHIPRDRGSEPVFHILDKVPLRRFRSAFPVLFGQAYGKAREAVLPIAAASEIMFSCALVHDDIIDNDRVRDGVRASHVEFGIEGCVISVDYVYARAFSMLLGLKQAVGNEVTQQVLDRFFWMQRTAYHSCIAERTHANDLDLPLETILQIYREKTVHGTNALACSALVCTEDEAFVDDVRDYCLNLAIAGQIKNDILDVTRHTKHRGFTDLANGYVTYLLHVLMNTAPDSRKIRDLIRSRDSIRLIKEIHAHGITEACASDCAGYVDKAISCIRGKVPSPLEQDMLAWAEAHRDFKA